MRNPRFRFTIRRMMILVAIAALLIAGVVMKRRREEYLVSAADNASDASLNLYLKNSWLDMAKSSREMAQLLRSTPLSIEIPPSEKKLPLPRGGFVIEQEHNEKMEQQAEQQGSEARDYERKAEKSDQKAARSLRRQAQFERAARYPWLSVAPEPK